MGELHGSGVIEIKIKAAEGKLDLSEVIQTPLDDSGTTTPTEGVAFEGSVTDLKPDEHFHFGHHYMEDGNMKYYTEENLTRRKRIRHDPEVESILNKFYKTYRSRKGKTRPGCVHKMEVTFVNVLICKALFDPNEFSIDDAWKAVEEDWQRESHGEDWMDEAHLKDSVFEIADLWTDAVEVSAYVGFLRELYQCITHPVGDKHQWTEVRSVSFHGSSTGENSMTDSKLMTSHEMTTRLKTMPSFTHSLHVASQQNSPRARSDETLDGFGQDQESSLGSAGKKNPWSPIRALARMAHLAKERRKKKEQQQDGEEEHHSEWGKVSHIAQSTGKFMTKLHKHLDIHKEESEKALEKPKKPERHRITTGKLEGGRPIQLKRGHKIAFTKDPNFRGNPKIIPCSAHVWDHLVEGDEILVGYPTMKSSLRVVQKTMDMLHATIEHNFMLGEDEVLYIEGLSNHPRPQHGALLNSHHSIQAAGVHHTPGEYRKRDEQMAKFNAAKKEYTQFVALDGNTIDKGQIGLNPRSSAGLLYRSLANSSSASSEEQRRQAALNRALHSGSVSMEVGQPVAVLGRHVGPPSPSGKKQVGVVQLSFDFGLGGSPGSSAEGLGHAGSSDHFLSPLRSSHRSQTGQRGSGPRLSTAAGQLAPSRGQSALGSGVRRPSPPPSPPRRSTAFAHGRRRVGNLGMGASGSPVGLDLLGGGGGHQPMHSGMKGGRLIRGSIAEQQHLKWQQQPHQPAQAVVPVLRGGGVGGSGGGGGGGALPIVGEAPPVGGTRGGGGALHGGGSPRGGSPRLGKVQVVAAAEVVSPSIGTSGNDKRGLVGGKIRRPVAARPFTRPKKQNHSRTFGGNGIERTFQPASALGTV